VDPAGPAAERLEFHRGVSPSQKIAIAAAATFKTSAFNSQGVEPNASDPMFRTIGAYLAPGDPPPVKK
jgi:hypothetical protein